MKAIKVTYKDGACTTPCNVKGSYVMVGSLTCQRCPNFDAYDEGKGPVVLCSHPDQTTGEYVHE